MLKTSLETKSFRVTLPPEMLNAKSFISSPLPLEMQHIKPGPDQGEHHHTHLRNEELQLATSSCRCDSDIEIFSRKKYSESALC